jgi:hypothetical protein
MNKIAQKWTWAAMPGKSAMVISLAVIFGAVGTANADEADAKRLLKNMSDYVGAQKAISFDYDASLEVVSNEGQKLNLASSGAVDIQRPDKIRFTRSGGFADVEMNFDGKTLTLLGHNMNLYAQQPVPGTIDNLINELRDKYNRPLPAADLLMKDSYDVLMADVVDIKDLGSGVIGGVECDYLAFRAKEVDWQIWIAHGDKPYPCQYTITSKQVDGGPQYSLRIRNWKAGDAVAATDFTFKNSTDAEKVDITKLKGAGELPDNFTTGAN